MRTSFIATATLLVASVAAFGEAPPKSDLQVQAMGYYVGAWVGHGEAKPGLFGTGGKLSSKTNCEWFTGGHQVVCRGEEIGPTGMRNFLALKSYDAQARSYTEYSISSRGESEYDRGGTLTGKTLTWSLEQDAGGGKKVRIRYTEVHISPDHYTYKTEGSVNRAPWSLLATGEIDRIK